MLLTYNFSYYSRLENLVNLGNVGRYSQLGKYVFLKPVKVNLIYNGISSDERLPYMISFNNVGKYIIYIKQVSCASFKIMTRLLFIIPTRA